jgi:hypothetical protein
LKCFLSEQTCNVIDEYVIDKIKVIGSENRIIAPPLYVRGKESMEFTINESMILIGHKDGPIIPVIKNIESSKLYLDRLYKLRSNQNVTKSEFISLIRKQ